MKFKLVLYNDDNLQGREWELGSELDIPDSEEIVDAITLELEDAGRTLVQWNRGET